MNYDMSSYFEDPEFKDILAKYEGMVKDHTPTYFDAEELTDIAEYYASIEQEEKANAAIEFALRLHPTNTDALVFKSRSLCIKGKLEEAYQIMNLIEDTSDREVLFLKADLLIEERRLEEADIIFQELASVEDNAFETLLDILLVYMDTNQQEYAAKWIRMLRDNGYNENNSQKFRDAWCDYCMTFGFPEKATNAFILSLDEQPYSIMHWNGLAKCYLSQMDLEKAHEAVDFALAIDENNLEALEVRAFCCMQNDNYEEAITIFQNLLSRTKSPSRIYGLLVKCYLDQEKALDAKRTCIEWLEKCENLTKYEKSEIYSYISMCCFNLQEPIEGMKYIDVALTLEPSFRGAILQKGMLHLQLNENNEAERLFQKVLDISPDDEQSEILYNVANSYLFLKIYSKAIEWCEKIVTQYPKEQMEALYMIACCHYYLYDIESCMKYLSKIWEISNNRFEEDYLSDRRFKQMFSGIEILLKKNYDK